MISVVKQADGAYLVSLDVPELAVLYRIAAGYQIPCNEALASCINRGFDDNVANLISMADKARDERETGLSKG